ncbi:helix-turn-helix domain-containing protein [Rhodalgimonas zhirmunskyi]|uniref:Helix-turn-helix domain-containing protein n=1 Tax=Rhodalgimonas zhirmunskyi TaxID=2964767 RepID=A0AAJ1X4Y5_9RHOB|nr:helix-turn-helix transcriptional regulator [Rhodoalgimonas zhirmunskyi]MDQ2094011.1 helix-turn-helix domain-containing protein [Rhodoalgimonas zhirmunskyi]
MSLGQRLIDACRRRDLSLAAACRAAGLKYSTLHAQISNDRAIPFESVDRIATALNIPVGYFSETRPSINILATPDATDEQRKTAEDTAEGLIIKVAQDLEPAMQISTDEILDWLITNEGRLINHEWFLEHVDLFHIAKPGDPAPVPFRIGSKSLAARYLNLLDKNQYDNVVGTFDPGFVRKLVEAHLQAAQQRYMITDMIIDEVIDGRRVSGTYRRILAPVVTPDGIPLMLLYSKLTKVTAR